VIVQACPCGSGAAYAACCGPLHQGAEPATTALALMRSRYAAFALGDAGYLFRTWHPRTRPDDVGLDPAITWTGLEITEVVAGGTEDQEGEVAFVARWRAPAGDRSGGGDGALTERSRFARRAGRWLYLDGSHD
jgi:SEC-C motif-containing protein